MRLVDASKVILKHLKKEPNRDRWLLSEPQLLYLAREQSQTYLKALSSKHYSSSFHSETVSLVQSHVKQIVGNQKKLSLVDLGPGFPDKAVPIASNCKRYGVDFEYLPVDVSEIFLQIAKDEMSQYTDNIRPVQLGFDELSKLQSPGNALVMIGLSFMNFDPKEILPVLKNVAGSDGRALVASEILANDVSVAAFKEKHKTGEYQDLAFGPLKAIGFGRSDVEHDVGFEGDRIESIFTLKIDFQVSPELKLLKGSKIVTAVSYLYTEKNLVTTLKNYFSNVEILKSKEGTTVLALLSV